MSVLHAHQQHYDSLAMASGDTDALPASALLSAKQAASRRASFAFLEHWLRDRDLAGKRILDFGCGMGDLSLFLADRGAVVVGVDVSAESVRVARLRATRHPLAHAPEFAVGNGEALDFPDSAFDMIVSQGVLSFVDVPAALAEITRVLKPDGLVVLSDTLGHHPVANIGRWISWRRGRATRWRRNNVVRAETLRDLRRRFAQAEIHHFDLFAPVLMPIDALLARRLPMAAPVLDPIIRLTQAIDRYALTIPFLRRYAFRFVAILGAPNR